jgi:hypothetical protein
MATLSASNIAVFKKSLMKDDFNCKSKKKLLHSIKTTSSCQTDKKTAAFFIRQKRGFLLQIA